jgi:chromosome segregation ATPase
MNQMTDDELKADLLAKMRFTESELANPASPIDRERAIKLVARTKQLFERKDETQREVQRLNAEIVALEASIPEMLDDLAHIRDELTEARTQQPLINDGSE